MVLLKSNQNLRENDHVVVQNIFEALEQAEEEDKQWENFKAAITVAAEEQIPRVERKTKQRWMTEDVLDIREKRRRVKSNGEKYETVHKEIREKSEEDL